MRPWILLFSWLWGWAALGLPPCPKPDLIAPCTCEFGEAGPDFDAPTDSPVFVDCSAATASEIFSAFNDVAWASDQKYFDIWWNDALTDLPSGVFGDVSFHAIQIHGARNLERMDPDALERSGDRLRDLTVAFCRLGDFPWEALPRLGELRSVDASDNAIARLPAIESPTLQSLYLQQNDISDVRAGWATPELKVLDLDNNPISSLPPEFLEGLGSLESFSCWGCRLGPTLPSGSMAFRSPALKVVELYGNGIEIVEPGAITGLTADTRVNLHYNRISSLREESLRGMLEALSPGTGQLDVYGNPVECGCSMAWIVLDPEFLKSVKGECKDGTAFQELDPGSFRDRLS
ncbi:unnamed protein product [Darwinula stevensoni]|uniref:Leucine-rich repeat domain-containing protein n=1 Tax=Darwinula stevensoni TaxID=69355 RepID=A0A7R8XD24_9CRUS|nr:unnamed protein product [Darwinula stevensoni]CAG0888219.1 unnamed protein product [Darwinula stevensoni]